MYPRLPRGPKRASSRWRRASKAGSSFHPRSGAAWSDGGLVLLREAECRLGLAEPLAGCIRDRRNQAQVFHPLSAMLRFRMLAIACGYEHAND